jgi:uncharacterized protein YqgV (UPF0045/DUF77 family)
LTNEEILLEERLLIAPPRGTELSDMVEEFWEAQRRRIAFQLKIVSRAKNELKQMITDIEVQRVVIGFEEALRNKVSFEKALKEAMEKLNSLKGKEEAIPYFTLIEMIKQKKSFEKIIEYVKPILKERGRWSEWTEIFYRRHKEYEERLKEIITKAVEDWPVWQNWLKYVRGIDVLLAAQIKGGLEMALAPGETLGTHFKTPSQLRQYAGLGDVAKSKRVKGEKLHCNLRLKSVLLGRVATCLLMQVDRKTGAPGGYRKLYLKFKEEIIKKYEARGIKIVPASQLPEKDGKKFEPPGVISEGHIHRQAVRKMMQVFGTHLWEILRKAEGLPAGPEESYAFKVLKHPLSSYIPPIRDIEY